MALNEYLGVKYGKPKKQPFTAERIFGVYTMYLPDRTLYFGRGNSSTIGALPSEIDAYFPMSPLSNPETLKAMGFKYMMVTPERLATSDYVRRNGVIEVFSDSGGFQLSRGVVDFIDPQDVLDFYKKKIDYGIGLDVPIPLHLQSTDWFLRMSHVQTANNKFISAGLKGTKCKLYDVSHGLTLENRARFLEDVLEHKSGDFLALGGIGQANYDTAIVSKVMAVVNLCYVVDRAKGVYPRFHVLGTTSPFMVSIYTLLTELGIAPYITADSSTYAQAGLAFTTRGTMYQNTMGMMPAFTIGTAPISYGLPCNCPICSLAGYPHAYRLSNTANAMHTLYLTKRMSTVTSEYTKLLINSESVMPQLLRTVNPNSALDSLHRALYKFVFDMPLGFDKAWAKHKHIFEASMRKEKRATGLFKQEQVLHPQQLRAEANVKAAIIRYEELHGLSAKITKKKRHTK